MLPLNDLSATRLRGSHTAPILMTATGPDSTVALFPTAGQITSDLGRNVRRQLSFTVPGSALAPAGQIGVLSPLAGSTIAVWRGIGSKVARRGSPFTDAFGPEFNHLWVTWAEDEVQFLPAGVFTAVETSIATTSEGDVLTVQAEDKTTALNRPWTKELHIRYGTPASEALRLILAGQGIPESGYAINLPSDYSTPALLLGADTGSTPLEACVDLAKVCGHHFYADTSGRFTTAPMQSTLDAPQAMLDGQVVTGIDRTVQVGQAINGVVVRAEGSSMLSPARAEVWDDDPLSPLCRKGIFGEAGKVVASAKILNQSQADQVARVLFGAWAGVEFEVMTIPQPHLECGDVVQVEVGGIDVTAIVESLTLPLDPEQEARLTLRTRRLL